MSCRRPGGVRRGAKHFRGRASYPPGVRPAIDEADFRRAPVGACLASSSFLYYCPLQRLCGFAIWGRPDGDELRRLERLLRIELEEGFPPHVSLVDASRLDGVDPTAFEALHAYVSAERDRLARKVERLAIVRPPGLTGATVAGFFHVTEPPYPVESFATSREAMRWLGEGGDAVAAAIDDAVRDATGAPALVVALRQKLDAKPGQLALEHAAQALGLSARSLQRALQKTGSTYQQEVASSQIRVAQRLMRDSSAPLTAIAFEVGCGTPQHFSTLFRRLVGESPSAWRARQRSSR